MKENESEIVNSLLRRIGVLESQILKEQKKNEILKLAIEERLHEMYSDVYQPDVYEADSLAIALDKAGKEDL
jgi:hypothetical protein